MKKLVGYCRVSTQEQVSNETITIQRDALTQYCESNGYELIQIFSDDGFSGTLDLEGRAGLAGCFDFIETHSDVCAILVYKMDRFSRDMFTTEFLLRKLKALNKGIVSVTEPYIENDGGDPLKVAFRQFLTIIAQLERSFISMRLQAGKNRKATRGGFCGSRVPMGYQTTADKELVVDNDAADVIRTIFSLREKGYTLRQISEYLNSNNVPTSRHRVWYARTVKYMLDNPLYQGKSRYKTVSVSRADLALV